eukprot:COSAG02_NODE_10923_length_1831_cov_1.228060_1_plen_96_part_00
MQALLQLQQRAEARGQSGGMDIAQEEVRTAVTRVYTATIAALKEADERVRDNLRAASTAIQGLATREDYVDEDGESITAETVRANAAEEYPNLDS